MQGWAATRRHRVTRKRCKKILKHTRKKEPTVKTCLLILDLKPFRSCIKRKEFYRQRIPEFSCVRKETVDIDIFVTSRNGDRKIMQSVRITSRPPTGKRKWNHLSQFWRTSTKKYPKKRLKLASFWKWAKGLREATNEEPTVLHIRFCSLSNNSK